MQVRLEADRLCVSRAGRQVLRGISFSVARGEVYGLLGGNGAGKSTTLLAFLGFLPALGGTVRVNGSDVGANLSAARRSISYLPEAASLYEHLTARENLRYFLHLAGLTPGPNEIEAGLDRVLLAQEARDSRLKYYSKGMRQKVAIALSILRNAEILLLDEPTSGLDPSAIDEFHEIVRGLVDTGKTVLMVTHDVYGACHVADRIGLLRGGLLVGEFSAPSGGRIETEAVHRAFARREAA